MGGQQRVREERRVKRNIQERKGDNKEKLRSGAKERKPGSGTEGESQRWGGLEGGEGKGEEMGD